MKESPSLATLDTSSEEAAPGPVRLMDSGQEHNLLVLVSQHNMFDAWFPDDNF